MAGHSQFKNIMHRKGAQDRKRAKIFNKIAREITVAAKLGQADPAMNPRLRAAIQSARAANMPNNRIQGALQAAQINAQDSANYEEIRYEGYGAGGVAVVVEALTDNRNRTASEVRSAFTKNEGILGETGSVSFMFKKIGQITYPVTAGEADKIFELAVEAGADNVESDRSIHTITTEVSDFSVVRDTLEKILGAPESAALVWQPLNTVKVGGEDADDLMSLIEELEDSDDVQSVFANFEMDDEDIARISAKG